ncbi:MAG: hypothetical protein IKV82_01695 [Akkermansia sp.]|nr:hypothetical protein [Akkermansia sp.]
MNKHINQQIKNNIRHLRSHLKTIITRACICARSLDVYCPTPANPAIPITLIQDLHHITDTATHAIHLAQLNNSLHRILTTLPNTDPTPDPTPDPPPYRPSSPHLTTTPATLIG